MEQLFPLLVVILNTWLLSGTCVCKELYGSGSSDLSKIFKKSNTVKQYVPGIVRTYLLIIYTNSVEQGPLPIRYIINSSHITYSKIAYFCLTRIKYLVRFSISYSIIVASEKNSITLKCRFKLFRSSKREKSRAKFASV